MPRPATFALLRRDRYGSGPTPDPPFGADFTAFMAIRLGVQNGMIWRCPDGRPMRVRPSLMAYMDMTGPLGSGQCL